MPTFHAKITGRDSIAMLDLVRKYQVIVARHTVEKVTKGYQVDAHPTGMQIRRLQAAGYTVNRLEDSEKLSKARQREVRKVGKQALTAQALTVAQSAHYLNVDEVETALSLLATAPNDSFISALKLPHKTWEKRACNALKIAKGVGANRPGIYLLGGIHAREWGSPDILINFVQQLADAYRSNSGISIGGKSFNATQIQSLVNTKDLFVFPQANPDGRHHSMTADAMWRKNRRPAPAGHTQPSCVGVDINRNYDFLWDYPKYFDPASVVQNSTDPCDAQVYIGPSPASEPETKNVVSLFDRFANIRYFVDLHSYSEGILYNWGDDEIQTTNPSMNFQNAAFNGMRGVAGDNRYREFMAAADKTTAESFALTMRDAIKAIRGRQYKVEQAMSLYPTAGTSDDYAFSRHIVDSSKAKVYSYTIEWGSQSNPTPFHPPYPEMKIIVQEITAALLAFCIAAT